MKNQVLHLRAVGLAEAVSYMLLVGIAMPLKYLWHQPMAVRVLGLLHGLLFIIFCAALARAALAARWPLSRAALVFLASLLPFGPFLLDKRLRAWNLEFSNQ